MSKVSTIHMKAIYRNQPYIFDSVQSLVAEKLSNHSISHKMSAEGKFISFSLSFDIESDDELNAFTRALSSIEGFMMMA